MYSPTGYTSFATLWKRFTCKHFTQIYCLAAKDYAGPNAKRSFKFGSPADICEHIFLKSLCDQPVVLASKQAGIANVEIELDRQFNSIYTVNTPFESVLTVSELRKGGSDQDVLSRMGSNRFSPWDYDYNDQAAWAKHYPEGVGREQTDLNIEQTPFHTLPFSFERVRFVVPEEAPPWTTDAFHKDYTTQIIRDFAGSSYCLEDRALKSWSSSCRGKIESVFGRKSSKDLGGRPIKKEDVANFIEQTYPSGIKGIRQKVVLSQAEHVLGYPVSLSTFKTALKIMKEKRSKTGSKTP